MLLSPTLALDPYFQIELHSNLRPNYHLHIYLTTVSVICSILEISLPANLPILIHSLIFALNLLNTNSAIILATSFSIPSSLFKTLTASIRFKMNDCKPC